MLLLGCLLPLTAIAQTNPLEWAYCDAEYRAAGAVVAVIPVHTNILSGQTVVLPVGILMCDEATNNPLWHLGFNFGTNVSILPRVNVKVSPGYVYYGPDFDGQPHYTYSSRYPIFIEGTMDLHDWTTNYTLCLYSMRSQDGVGPCESTTFMGFIEGVLYSGSNTNGLDGWTGAVTLTNSLMSRFGTGACDNRTDDYQSRSAVAFLYFNLPPRPITRIGYPGDPTYVWACQPATNFLQYPYDVSGWCGFTTNYAPGFVFSAANRDNPQNWSNYPAPCDTNLFSMQLFRARCYGSPNCQGGTPPNLISSPFAAHLTK